ncbi:hypothetical protein [Erwinia billingiae]|uniref:hypothetical protein n=1 Tax=Erwinia billingiae TaxID=182337 RepID=UPI0019D1091D|nr:hypothetical protein [Erwinia billingiae]
MVLALFIAIFQAEAEISAVTVQEIPSMTTTLVSAEAGAVLRIGCLEGNSLFISFAVPSGGFEAGRLSLSGPGGAETRWIADGQAGSRVNIAYAATPRGLVRGLISRRTRQLIFTGAYGAEYTFAITQLPVWLQALPAACR